jgi:hypothetical protein
LDAVFVVKAGKELEKNKKVTRFKVLAELVPNSYASTLLHPDICQWQSELLKSYVIALDS